MSSGLRFERFAGIDYSGAGAPESGQKGLRVYLAEGGAPPREVHPPPGPRKFWSRRGLALWLQDLLAQPIPALVGIDHSFSFPLAYFQKYGLLPEWQRFLEDFCAHWPTADPGACVDSIRKGQRGRGALRTGNSRWRRLAEMRCGAKSVFHFDVPGSVAKSTHAGLPWLLLLRRSLGPRVHFWPFDGWEVPPGRSVVAEVYPSLSRDAFPAPALSPDQQDAFAAAAWLQQASVQGTLEGFLQPDLTPEEREAARWEGWILGVR